MKKLSFLSILLVVTVLLICPILASPQELAPIKLLKPQLDRGRPLMQVLNDRKSARDYIENKKLPTQELSNLLWAAFGVNRPESGKRTAPSARNWQETDIYVAMADGLFLYDAKSHILNPILAEDIRALTGKQDFAKTAPINLIYVADLSRISDTEPEKMFFAALSTGFISQNVYLYCASEGLATVVRGLVDKPALAKVMKLRPDQKITLSQSVGYAK